MSDTAQFCPRAVTPAFAQQLPESPSTVLRLIAGRDLGTVLPSADGNGPGILDFQNQAIRADVARVRCSVGVVITKLVLRENARASATNGNAAHRTRNKPPRKLH
jgi:hypothetical protein